MGVLSVDDTFAADGPSEPWNVPVSGEYMFYAVGEFGGGCIELEASPNNGVNWFTVDQLTEPGRLIRYLVSGEKVRLCLSGATAPDVTTGLRQ
jgi:hypothetical protein